MALHRYCFIALTCFARVEPWRPYYGDTRIYEGAPADYRFDGKVPEWTGPFYEPKVQWRFHATAKGIVIAGTAPDIDPTRAEVELWLAGPSQVEMPAPGWVGRFQSVRFRSTDQCGEYPFQHPDGIERCRAWVRAALASQDDVRRLFTRRYVWHAGEVRETWAAPSLAALRRRFVPDVHQPGPVRDLMPGFRALGSSELPLVRTAFDRAFTVEIELPWEAFPPMDNLVLDHFRWSLRIGNHDPKKTAPRPSWSPVTLVTPRRYRLSECEYGLRGYPLSRDLDQVWFRPTHDDLIRQVIFLENPRDWGGAPGWQINAKGQLTVRGASPRAVVSKAYGHELEPGLWVCGPVPARRWEGHTMITDPPAEYRGGFLGAEPPRRRRLPDGTWLVLSEPNSGVRSYLGGGMSGASLVGTVNAWLVTPERIRPVRGVQTREDTIKEIDDWEIEFADDLQKALVFERTLFNGEWSKTPFCFRSGGYVPCGSAVTGQPVHRTRKRLAWE